jgi:WD40 repeat protein/serine/threonine protein kinase/tetratricopeptide (TPR) repeat protein
MATDAPPLRWYYARDRQKLGPVTLDQLRELACRGELKPADMLLPEGASRWLAASEVSGLFDQGGTVSQDWPTLPGPVPPVSSASTGLDALPPQPGTVVQPPQQVEASVRASLAASVATLVPGYEILGVLGRGGMGVVYKARQTSLNRLVALKMIRSGAHAGSQERARFLVEAEAVARLSHPNIVQIHEIGEQDGCPYFSLEFVEGGSLDRMIDGTPQVPREAAALAQQLARAMQHAHEHGIIHRDLKPANVLLQGIHHKDTKDTKDTKAEDHAGSKQEPPLGPFGPLCLCGDLVLAKITDFGLARQLADDQRLTQSGAVMGSPSYMAPEQARGHGHAIGPLTDVYGLGAILYEMLTGRPPFKGASTAETLLLVTTAEPVPPRQLAPGIPRDLETICLKCLQKEPGRRYRSSGELADDLGRFLEDRPIHARPLGRIARTGRWCRRNPALAAVTLLFWLALVAGVSGIAWKWREAVTNYEGMVYQKGQADENAENERTQRRLAEERELANLRVVYAARMSQLPQDWENGDVAAVERHLEAFLPRPGQKHDVRGYEWYRYWKMTRGSRLTLDGHTQGITALVFSPDGKLLASGSGDTQVHIWDANTGKERDVIALPSSPSALAFTADSKTLFISWGLSRVIWTYNLTDKVFGPEQGAGRSLLVTPDGRFLLASDPSDFGLIRVLTSPQRKQVATFNVGGLHVALTPDGRSLICAVGRSIETHGVERDWDRDAVKLRHRVEAHADGIAWMALSADGKALVTVPVGNHKTAKLWAFEEEGKPPVLRSTLKDHPTTINAVALSPDGKRVFTAGFDGLIRVWEAQAPALRLLATLRGHAKAVEHLAVSPDGKQLASGGEDASVKVWDLAELPGNASSPGPAGSLHRLQRELEGLLPENDPLPPARSGSIARAVAFSPDDRLLATGGQDAVVRVWDLTDRRQRFALREHADEVLGVAFPPGGQGLLSVSRDGLACRWELKRGGLVGRRRLEGEITCCAVSPDGTALACGGMDGRVLLLGPDGGPAMPGPPGAARPHQTRVSALAFSPDGKTLLSGAWDGSVALTDLTTGIARPCVPQLWQAINCVTFSRDGKQVLAAYRSAERAARDGKQVLARDHMPHCAAWDPATREPIDRFEAVVYQRFAVVRQPKGEWLAWASHIGTAGKVVRADRPGGNDANAASLIQLSEISLVALACSHDGSRLAATDWYGGVTLCDVPGQRALFRLPGHAHEVHAVAFSPDGKWLAHADGFQAHLLDAATRREQAVLAGHEDVVTAVAFSPDGRTLATASWDRTVRLWDLPSGKPAGVLQGAKFPLRTLAFSPDGRTVAAGGGQMDGRSDLLLWDVKTASLRARLPTKRWMLRGLVFAPDGRTLFSVSGDGWEGVAGDLEVWDVESGKELLRLVPHSHAIAAVALSPDGKLLATADTAGVLRLWDVRGPGSLVPRHLFRGVGRVHSLAFTVDGHTLAVGGGNGFISLWQPELGQSVGRLDCPPGALAVAFSPDGRTLAVGEAGGNLRLLEAAPPDQVRAQSVPGSQADLARDLQVETGRLRVLARQNLASLLAEGDAAGQKEMLEKAVAELDELSSGAPELESLRMQQVELLCRLARLHGAETVAGAQFASRAAELAGKLPAADPSVPRHLFLRGDALFLLGHARRAAKRYDEALSPAEGAVECFRQLARHQPEQSSNLGSLALALGVLGSVHEARREPDRALACFREAAATYEEQARSSGFGGWFREDINFPLGRFLFLSAQRKVPGKLADAEKRELADALRRFCELLDQRVLWPRSDEELRDSAADWHRFWRYPLWRELVRDGVISPDEADDSYRRAVGHYTALVKMHPGEVKYRDRLVNCYAEWGALLDSKERYAGAEKVYATLVKECQALKDLEPRVRSRHFDVYEILRRQAWAIARQSRHEEAVQVMREALRMAREAMLVLGKEEQDLLQRNHATLLRNLAEIELLRNNHAAAGKALEEALALPLESRTWMGTGELLGRCERVARRDDRLSAEQKEQAAKRYLDGAMTALRKAVEGDPKFRSLLEDNPDLDGLRQREDFKKLLEK